MRTDGLPADKLARLEVFIAIAQNEDAATAEADVTLPCKSVYEQDGSLINWYGRLQRTWESVPAQRADTAAGWSWAERILTGLGGSGAKSGAGALRTPAERGAYPDGPSLAPL